MKKPITTPLPADLPENWTDTQFVSPGGTEVGLSEKHGYNYQSKQINEAQKAINALNEAFEKVLSIDGSVPMLAKLWFASKYGGIDANTHNIFLQSNNDPGNETTCRTFRVQNSTNKLLENALQLDDVIGTQIFSYFIYGQHNKALANKDILLADMNTAPTTDFPTDYPEGIRLYLESIFGQFPNRPSEFGLMLSIRHHDEVSQLWFTQAAGTVYRRSGNHGGWASGWVPLSGGVATATIEE